MRIRLGAALTSALTISVGIITVFGLLLSEQLGVPPRFVELTGVVTDTLLRLVTIIIALTFLIGVANLLYVHIRKLTDRQKGAIYSLVMIASFLLVVISYVVERETSMILLETVQLSVESALAGLLLFALVYGAFRMMRRRVTWSGVLFVTVLLVILIGALPLSGLDLIRDARDWLLEIPVSAGARGILLGIALATVVIGVRVLIGVDRSYRE